MDNTLSAPVDVLADVPAPMSGYARQWVQCRECQTVAYYDFTPYGLGNPLFTMPCGHGVGERLENAVKRITEAEARNALARVGGAK